MPGAAGRIRAPRLLEMFSVKDDSKAFDIPKVAYTAIVVPVHILADSTDAEAIVDLAMQIPEPWFTITGYGQARESAEMVIIRGEAPNLLEEKDPFARVDVAAVLPSLMFSLTLGQMVKAIAHYASHFDVDILRPVSGGYCHGMQANVDVVKISPYQASAIIEIALYGDVMFTY
jgi:hypothetical protein